MDLTSLLNANSSAAGQQRKEVSRTPPRNRTPWDAGGYSLPINTVSSMNTTTPTTPPYNIHYDDSHVETPRSPHHKFSDSRSSLSSFASSLQSASHSRFSSMSTVSSVIQPMNTILAESIALDSATKLQPLNLESAPVPINHSRSPSSATQPRGSISPTGSLDALALVAEGQQARQQPEPSASKGGEDNMSASKEGNSKVAIDKSMSSERPSSPSDAILIKRTTVPSLRLNTREQDLAEPSPAQFNRNYLSAPLENHHQSLIQGRTHKRALSAPDFTSSIHRFPILADSSSSVGPRAEPTPPSSHHPDSSSPTSPPGYTAPDTPPNMDAGNQAQAIACMYIPNCDTGSQLRKAISHIFGRNKMCTRLIPQHIWVHYCRKHYQRSRYRNPKEYAKLQCDLVQKQIRAIREWSESNKKKGDAGTVVDWGLAVRKREQKRLDEINAGGRKRTASAAFELGSDEEGGSRGNSVPATAVPSWLLDHCGKGYSTDEILGIFSRLHTEILNDEMPCFPDIEILPNIVVDQDEAKSPKGYTKRTPATGHKRSQSLGVSSMASSYYPAESRRMSQPGVWGQDASPYGGSSQKRQRPNEIGMESQERLIPSFQRPRMSERPVETGRRTQHLAHRPVHPSIQEHDDVYGPQNAYQHQLPAPVAQRHGSQSMAAQLETNNDHAYASRRGMHQRSQSDMSFARHETYSPTPSLDPAVQDRNGRVSRNFSPAYHPEQSYPSMQYADHHPSHVARPAYGHSRHQSTPMAQQLYHGQHSQHSPSGFGYVQGGNPLPPPVPQITESPQVQALYRSRR